MSDSDSDDPELTNHPAIQGANAAPSSRLSEFIKGVQSIKGKKYRFLVRTAEELNDNLKDRVWSVFQTNMQDIYISSKVFPWDPESKRREIFHLHARFLLVVPEAEREVQDSVGVDTNDSEDVLAYCVFRFEKDEGRCVVYVYELQARLEARRLGLGRAAIQAVSDIGEKLGMRRIMLTVIKDNNPARAFYGSLGFEVDLTSPDYDEDGQEVGYSILSRPIK